MKVLHVVSSLPTKEKPYIKPFIVSQIVSLKKNGVEIDICNLNATEKTFNYVKGVFKIIEQINKKCYDVIHAHYSYCGWCAGFQKKVPVIVSLMGNDLYGVLNTKGNQTPVGYFNIISTKILIKLVDAIIVKSNRMREMTNRNRVYVVPNGVDFTKFKPSLRDKRTTVLSSSRVKRILFLGNPKIRRKNLPLAQRAVEIIKKSNPEVELLTVFGVDQEKIVEFMNSSDLLLLTSLREGSPNVIKEAMACNLPIVSTDVGDVGEIISNTEGCYITSFEPEDVAEKIQMAFDFGKRTSGRENIRHLEINTIAKKIISIYEHVINKK